VTVGTRIGDFVVPTTIKLLKALNLHDMFMQDTLNDFISDGQKHGVWFGIELQNF
jgi:hypothetical protein